VVRLGRALSNDVILDDRRISRSHAQLRWRAGSYHLSDMGSRSGTRLNGRPLGPQDQVPLAAGDVIDLAGVTLTVHADAERPDLNT
jgi:pSer/pThr/pTyr-binding forkhead associated (FHA) protein